MSAMTRGEPVARPSEEPSSSIEERRRPEPSALIRDVLFLQLKLILEGLKDLLLGPIAIVATIIDLASRRSSEQRLFHHVLRGGERFERFLGLYSALPEHSSRRDHRTGDEADMDAILQWGEHRVRTLVDEHPNPDARKSEPHEATRREPRDTDGSGTPPLV